MKNYKALIVTEKILQAELKKPVVEITQEEMDKYIESIKNKYTYTTLRTKMCLFNLLFKQVGSSVFAELKKEDMKPVEKGIISKKDLLGAIELLDNAQDKFILLALFNGIAGKQAQELINLKSKDIDFEKNTISLPEKTIKMDTLFTSIARETIEEKEYKIISLDFQAGNVVETYEINEKCPYMIKVRPYKKNNMGMDAMSYNGFRTRFGTICKLLDLDVTVSSLEKSGIIHQMLEENVEETARGVEDWLKKKGLKMERFLALRLYKNAKDMLF